MNFLRFLGLKKKVKKKADAHDDVIHLWEDDYLMIELLAAENIDFIKAEADRINNFGKDHFDGTGFTDITPIGEKPVKTIEKLIDVSEIEELLKQAGLEKINKFYDQTAGLLEGDKVPLGYGTKNLVIMCESKGRLLQNLWLTGRTNNTEEKQKIVNAFILIGANYNFIAVNWYKCQYYYLTEKISIEEFVNDSC